MKAVVQRAAVAAVEISGERIATIGPGLLILLGIESIDDRSDVIWLAAKIASMRVFSDADGRMQQSLQDTKGGALVVSQFTLHASTKKGNRPSFTKAAAAAHAQPLYEDFCTELEMILMRPVARGRFGADMQVSLVNDGPVTIVIDSRSRE